MNWTEQQHVWVTDYTPDRSIDVDGGEIEPEAYTGNGVIAMIREDGAVVVACLAGFLLIQPRDVDRYLKPWDPYTAEETGRWR